MKTTKTVNSFISDANMTTIKYSVSQIRSALPFLISKTEKQLEASVKLDEKSIGFIAKALEYAINNPHLSAETLNMSEWKIKFLLLSRLWEILQLLAPLQQKIEDTFMVVDNDALQNAICFFDSVQIAFAKDVPGAKTVYKDLNKSFTKDMWEKILC